MAEHKETLRRLALNDESFVDSVLGMGHDTVEVSRLDQKTHALVRLAASLASDAAPSSYPVARRDGARRRRQHRRNRRAPGRDRAPNDSSELIVRDARRIR